MRHEPVELHERPGVEQHVESLPGGHLALFVLPAIRRAAAKLGFGRFCCSSSNFSRIVISKI